MFLAHSTSYQASILRTKDLQKKRTTKICVSIRSSDSSLFVIVGFILRSNISSQLYLIASAEKLKKSSLEEFKGENRQDTDQSSLCMIWILSVQEQNSCRHEIVYGFKNLISFYYFFVAQILLLCLVQWYQRWYGMEQGPE